MELKSWDSCKVMGIKSGTVTFGLSLCPRKCKSCSSCSFPTGDPGLPASGIFCDEARGGFGGSCPATYFLV